MDVSTVDLPTDGRNWYVPKGDGEARGRLLSAILTMLIRRQSLPGPGRCLGSPRSVSIMKQYKMIHGRDNVSPNASWSESTVFPRYTALLFCQKRQCRLDIKVCIHHNCKKLKEKHGVFTCAYKSKSQKLLEKRNDNI